MAKIPLTQLNPGAEGTIREINAGCRATKRLCEMGFYIGSNVKVLKNDKGPLIVSLSGNKIAIGRGLAQKIIVEHQN